MFDQAAVQLSTVATCCVLPSAALPKPAEFCHGSDNAYDEAVYLILHCSSLPLDRLEPFLDARWWTKKSARCWMLALRQPAILAAYLTREAWLGNTALCGRAGDCAASFIAELLPEALEPWIEYLQLVHCALDMCTGPAAWRCCWPIYPDADVDAVDLSADALAVARITAEQYGLQERIELIQSDLFSALAGREYDRSSAIRHVDAPSVAALPEEYLREPALALGSGEDGLDATREILRRAPGST